MNGSTRRPPDRFEVAWQRNIWLLRILFLTCTLALLLLLAALGIWWNLLEQPGHTARRERPAPPPTATPLPVAVVAAGATPTRETLLLNARPVTGPIRSVITPVSGRMTRLLVAPGASVAPGAPLARVVTTERHRHPVPLRTRLPRVATIRPFSPVAARVSRDVSAHERTRYALAAAESRVHEGIARRAEARAARAMARDASDAAAAGVSRARLEAAAKQTVYRQSERLFAAGAASRAEREEDRREYGASETRLGQALARAEAARGALVDAEARLAAAERALVDARAAAHRARAATAAPTAPEEPAPEPAVDREPIVAPPAQSTWQERRVSRATVLRAPEAGVVSRALVLSGSRVARGQAIVRIAAVAGRRFTAEGPSKRLRGVRAGDPARLRVGRSVTPARVVAVRSLGTGRTRIDVLSSRDLRLPAGSEVAQELSVPARGSGALVPAVAVRETGAGTAVWVVRAAPGGGRETAHRQSVQRGASRGERVEIRSGIPPGARVIVAGMERLHEGDPVRPIPWRLP